MYDSAHPQRCKDSIPYSQFLRIRRICSNMDDYDKHVICYSVYFLRKGYPIDLLEKAANRARDLNRLELLRPQTGPTTEPDTDKIYLITPYHPHNSSLKDLIYHNWGILGKSQATEELYNRKLRGSYRRPKNLWDLLVRAKVKRLPTDNQLDLSNKPSTTAPVATSTTSLTNMNIRKERNIPYFFSQAHPKQKPISQLPLPALQKIWRL